MKPTISLIPEPDRSVEARKSFTPKQRAEIFERNGGICYLSGVKIMPGDPWEVEHRLALALGGTNDIENLVPALIEPHRAKTKQDKRAIAKAKRLAGETGQNRVKKKIPSRGFQKPEGGYQWPKQSFRRREK